jgi:hypothetical protein
MEVIGGGNKVEAILAKTNPIAATQFATSVFVEAVNRRLAAGLSVRQTCLP